MKRVLFVTWDGPDQNYLESLFLPIFAATARHGFGFEVFQFRWGTAEQAEQSRAAAAAYGIPYRSSQIARRPKAAGALVSVARGAAQLRSVLQSGKVDVVMPRSILPAQMVNLIGSRVPVVFDADGLPADERVEFAGWSDQGWFYRAWRDIEAQAVRRASAVITRTSHAKQVLLGRAGPLVDAERIFVVPNGKDEGLFSSEVAGQRESIRTRFGVPESAPWLLFAGSIGPQYHPRELLAFFRLVRERAPQARLTVLTGQDAEMRSLLTEEGLSGSAVQVTRAAPADVPSYLVGADLGLAFRRPSFSQAAVSPIKVAEYLLCGLPVLATKGVGDLENQVPARAGRLLPDLGPGTLADAADWFLGEVMPQRAAYRDGARAAGLTSFSLAACAEKYAAALQLALEAPQLVALRSR